MESHIQTEMEKALPEEEKTEYECSCICFCEVQEVVLVLQHLIRSQQVLQSAVHQNRNWISGTSLTSQGLTEAKAPFVRVKFSPYDVDRI